MAAPNIYQKPPPRLDPLAQLSTVFANLSDASLLARLWLYRSAVGRRGYPLRPLWRAYVAGIFFNVNSTNDLIRRLRADAQFRRLCGFGSTLPHRTTFNRFIARLSYHPDLVQQCFAGVTGKLHERMPDLGEQVAIDSTTVRTHSAPNRKVVSDPDASWTAKNSPRVKGGKEWSFGYKLHMVADANYGIPLSVLVKTARHQDSPELPALVDRARAMFPWFRPQAAMADKGYDSRQNFQYLHDNGVDAVIMVRRQDLYADIYADPTVPTCVGGFPMEYVRSDPVKGRLFRCRKEKCWLLGHRIPLLVNCDARQWEKPGKELRVQGALRARSPEWKALYAKRSSIERTFKSLKQSRRLERHCHRGLRMVTLHAMMSVLVYQATVLVNVMADAAPTLRWQVVKVA